MSWPGDLFYTPAHQHWQLVLATSCMAASRFWTSRQELMPSEFPLTWATFRVQFPPNNPGEPGRNPWRKQKWKTLRYFFWWPKRAAQMQTCTCFSLDENTLSGCQLWARLGAWHRGAWRIFQLLQTGISHSSQSCQSGHSCVLFIPDLSFFLSFFFPSIFRRDSNLNVSFIAYTPLATALQCKRISNHTN